MENQTTQAAQAESKQDQQPKITQVQIDIARSIFMLERAIKVLEESAHTERNEIKLKMVKAIHALGEAEMLCRLQREPGNGGITEASQGFELFFPFLPGSRATVSDNFPITKKRGLIISVSDSRRMCDLTSEYQNSTWPEEKAVYGKKLDSFVDEVSRKSEESWRNPEIAARFTPPVCRGQGE